MSASQSQLLARTVLLKLNGGLGTSMGLDKPKSLLPVHANGRTFLDLIVEQVSVLRRKFGAQVENYTFSLRLTRFLSLAL